MEQKNESSKIHPFNVMDQRVAYRLAMEGFEILNVIPSNKYSAEAHFIFCFNGNSAFKKRFKAVLAEEESKLSAQNAKKMQNSEEKPQKSNENEQKCEDLPNNSKDLLAFAEKMLSSKDDLAKYSSELRAYLEQVEAAVSEISKSIMDIEEYENTFHSAVTDLLTSQIQPNIASDEKEV